MISLVRRRCACKAPNRFRKTEASHDRHPERSAAESKDPADQVNVTLRVESLAPQTLRGLRCSLDFARNNGAFERLSFDMLA
ncbi:MAG: hypothetical protein DME53_13875 [Verrucomicrobia bacterium]|nr:MAG: hypothetical protein DME56_13300 [Verrucomicrobiota bacterium]PYK42942.1 MAG: hypothetical protein DME53_13875 [Verrucomicrobiota bacterium]